MKKSVAMALLLALLVCSAAAGIEGEGWFDDDYIGSTVLIEGTDLTVKVPARWADIRFEETMQIYQDTVGGMYFYLYTLPEEGWEAYSAYARGASPYEETASIILQEDRDWIVLTEDGILIAVTPLRDGAVVFEFMILSEEDWVWARRIVSSVRALQAD